MPYYTYRNVQAILLAPLLLPVWHIVSVTIQAPWFEACMCNVRRASIIGRWGRWCARAWVCASQTQATNKTKHKTEKKSFFISHSTYINPLAFVVQELILTMNCFGLQCRPFAKLTWSCWNIILTRTVNTFHECRWYFVIFSFGWTRIPTGINLRSLSGV